MTELIVRFVVGGVVISFFAVLGDVLKPKSFAGLFGAAPSVALAALGLTIWANGKLFAAREARSMTGGAIAFLIYACFCTRLMKKHRVSAVPATIAGLGIWLICALGAWLVLR